MTFPIIVNLVNAWPRRTPHPGAQPRFTDPGGQRFTCFATSNKGGQLADLDAAGPVGTTTAPLWRVSN